MGEGELTTCGWLPEQLLGTNWRGTPQRGIRQRVVDAADIKAPPTTGLASCSDSKLCLNWTEVQVRWSLRGVSLLFLYNKPAVKPCSFRSQPCPSSELTPSYKIGSCCRPRVPLPFLSHLCPMGKPFVAAHTTGGVGQLEEVGAWLRERGAGNPRGSR